MDALSISNLISTNLWAFSFTLQICCRLQPFGMKNYQRWCLTMWMKRKSMGPFQCICQQFQGNTLVGPLLALVGLCYPGTLDKPGILRLLSSIPALSNGYIEEVLTLGCCMWINNGWHRWLILLTCSRSWVGEECLSFSMTGMKQWSCSSMPL